MGYNLEPRPRHPAGKYNLVDLFDEAFQTGRPADAIATSSDSALASKRRVDSMGLESEDEDEDKDEGPIPGILRASRPQAPKTGTQFINVVSISSVYV